MNFDIVTTDNIRINNNNIIRKVFESSCLSVGQFVPWSVALQNLIGPIAFQFCPDFFNFINSALRLFVWPSF